MRGLRRDLRGGDVVHERNQQGGEDESDHDGEKGVGVSQRMAFDLGGRENLTEAQQQLIRRCAMISAQCELMEQETVGGKPLNAIAYGTLTGHLDSDAERARPQAGADRRDASLARISRHAAGAG